MPLPVNGGERPDREARPAAPRGVVALVPLLAAAVAAAAVLLPNLGTMSLWGSEGRWALIARAMWTTGDLFRPEMGAHLYWDKPLLSYWQVLPFAALHGGVDELVLRLPSAVWAVVLVCLTYDLAARWSDRATALLASLVLSSSLGFVVWGRNAQVEMTNAAVILLLVWIFVRHRRDAGSAWVYAVAVVAGLGANMKGLTAYGVPAFCVLLIAAVERDWSWLPGWRTILAAALLSLAVLAAFPVAASLATGSREPFTIAWRENVLRYFAPFDHEDPAWTYFVRVFDLFAPWSLLLPLALARRVPALWRRDEPPSEALLCALATFAFFTLSGSRRPYYLLPILPFLACLVADVLRDWTRGRVAPRAARLVSTLFAVLGAVLIASLAAYVVALPFARRLPVDPSGLGWAVLGFAVAGAAMARAARSGSAVGLVLATLAVWVVYGAAIVPFAAAHSGLRDEAAQLRDLRRPCGLFAAEDADLEFYVGETCAEFDDEAAALAWAHRSGGFVVTTRPLGPPAWREVLRSRSRRTVVAAEGAAPDAPAE